MSEDEFRFLTVRRMKGRLLADEVGYLLNCSAEEVHTLAREHLLKPLGKPPENGKKFFATKSVLEVMDDPNWLSRITNTLYGRWKKKNASRRSKTLKLNGHARNT